MEKTQDHNLSSEATVLSKPFDGDGEKPTAPLSVQDTISASQEASVDNLETTIPAEEEHEYLGGYQLFFALFAPTLVGFLMLLDTSIVSTAVPRITSDFHSLNDVGWYGTSYLLTNCALQPLTGKIYSNFSTKWTFLVFFGIFEFGSLLCGTAVSSNMLIIGRAVAGLGASGILNGAYNIVHAAVPLPKQPVYLGILIGISQLGLLGGPLIGGALTEYASWRWCFYINLPCGAPVALLFSAIVIPERKTNDVREQTVLQRVGKLDLFGFSLFAPAAIQFLLALEWGGTKHPWGSATVIGLFCGAFGTLLVFLAWEYHMSDGAMIPLSIIRRRVVWSSCVNYGCLMGATLSSTFYLPIYFQAARDATPTLSGVDLLPSMLGTIIFGITSGILMGKIGYYMPFAIASGIIATIGLGLATTFTPTTAVGTWIGYQIIMGGGRGLGIQIPLVAVQNNSSQKEIPITTAMVVFCQNFGGVLFLTLAQVIFSNRLRHNLETYAPGVSAEAVIEAGATTFREVVEKALLGGVLVAYTKAVDDVFKMAAGAAGGALLSAFGMGWVNIKKLKEKKKEDKAVSEAVSQQEGEIPSS